MIHRFYSKSYRQQVLTQCKIALIILSLNIPLVLIFWWIGKIALLSLPLLLFVSISLLAPFVDTPGMRRKGTLVYFSNFLLAEKERNQQVDLHGGTLLEYVYALPPEKEKRQRLVFLEFLDGLLKLIDHYERKNERDVRFKFTSYFINERTAKKIGFYKEKTDGLQQMILLLNILNISCSLSILKGRLTFPNLSNTRTFHSSLQTLIEKKGYILRLHKQYQSNLYANETPLV